MSTLLHAEYMKLVDTGGDLDAASELELIEGEPVVINIEGKEILHITSKSPNPNEIVEVGTNVEGKAVLAAATRQHMAQILGGTYSGGTYSKTQGIRTLGKKDIRFAIRDTSNALHLIDLSAVFLKPMMENSFKQGERFYQPIEFRGSDTTQYTHDEP